MVAIEVAMAIFTASGGATPRPLRMKVRKGTIIMPPPTPSSPARKPAVMPSASSSATSVGDKPISGPAASAPPATRPASPA